MKKIYVLLAVCSVLAILVAFPGRVRSGTDAPAKPKTCKLTLVEKGKKIKVLTPAQIQSGIVVPEEFLVYATGKIDDVDITLLDVNKDECYGDAGTDAFILGNSTCALPASRIINFKNKLYECEVATDGSLITLTPFQGDVGQVDLLSDFKCALKPELLILKSDNIYLDVSKGKSVMVPCGSYSLWLGYIGDKKSSLAIRSGQMNAIEVVKPEDPEAKPTTVKIQWGAPYKIDCECIINDNAITITESVNVYGWAGEEYYNFTPSILPAAMEMFDATKQLVAKGVINRSVAPVAKSFEGVRREGGYATAAAGAAAANIPDTGTKGGYRGPLKKGAVPPYILKITVKNSMLGELKGEKEIK